MFTYSCDTRTTPVESENVPVVPEVTKRGRLERRVPRPFEEPRVAHADSIEKEFWVKLGRGVFFDGMYHGFNFPSDTNF